MPASEILLTIQTDTKEEEKEIINQFLARLQYTPTSLNPSECPDFEVQICEKQIGIEVTKYYSDFTEVGSPFQKKISAWIKFSKTLKHKLKELNHKYDYLYGSMHFLHTGKVNNYKEFLKNEFCTELITLIKTNELKEGERNTISVTQTIFPTLGNHVDSIYLRNTFPENKYLWWDSSLQSGEVIKNTNALKHIIDKKENSAKNYRPNYFQKWLIIYAGGNGLHDMYTTNTGKMYRQELVRFTHLTDALPVEFQECRSEYFTHIFLWDKFTETIYLIHPCSELVFDCDKGVICKDHLPFKE